MADLFADNSLVEARFVDILEGAPHMLNPESLLDGLISFQVVGFLIIIAITLILIYEKMNNGKDKDSK